MRLVTRPCQNALMLIPTSAGARLGHLHWHVACRQMRLTLRRHPHLDADLYHTRWREK